jgi:hypothetical protein
LDKTASDYTPKRCKPCANRDGCKFKGTDEICPEQKLKWAAYECGCGESEYFKALLNVSVHGDRLQTVTWSGCEDGEGRDWR